MLCFFAVFYECSTWTNKRCEYNNIILNFRTFRYSNRVNDGTSLCKCSKFGFCFCQHGWCCHDNIREDLGWEWIPVEHIIVGFWSSHFLELFTSYIFECFPEILFHFFPPVWSGAQRQKPFFSRIRFCFALSYDWWTLHRSNTSYFIIVNHHRINYWQTKDKH